MKHIASTVAISLLTAVAVFCAENNTDKADVQTAPTSIATPAEQKMDLVHDQVDTIIMKGIDIEAMYWAWRVAGDKNVTYAELEKSSKNWIMKPATRNEFLRILKNTLDKGKARPLTAEEMKKREENVDRRRAVLSPGRADKELAKTLSEDYCIDLQARYWAERIQTGERDILAKRNNWALPKDFKKRLFARMDERLEMQNPRLSEKELYASDACVGKFN